MEDQQRMSFFYQLFDATLPRLGRGDASSTNKALDLLLSSKPPSSDAELKVLDIGCGNGAQTLELAKRINGSILAVDNHQPYLDELQQRAESFGLAERIQPHLGDMRTLDWAAGSFDLIWSEGALYAIGLREGLLACHRLLVPDGLVGITDIAWLRPNPPQECKQFFVSECPFMTNVDALLDIIADCGFKLLDYFVLQESAWWLDYYGPLEERLKLFRTQSATDPERMGMIESVQTEIELYRQYSDYYGYVFCLMQRS